MSLANIERVGPADRFADYCLWDYPPVTAPLGKLRSSSLLWTFLDHTDPDGGIRACCEAIRQAVGPFRTVWGIKQRDGRHAVELYFYDYARLERRVSIPRVLGALAPRLDCSLSLPERRPYFMFSLDLDAAVLRSGCLAELSVYVGNPSSGVSSGLCYNLSAGGLRLDNLYHFFKRTELDDIRAKIACSAHLDLRAFRFEAVLWPGQMGCGIVVVANKRFNDGIYFSRLPLDGFCDFLRRAAFPAAFTTFVEDHRAELDHLLFDVGFDYIWDGEQIRVVKTAVYGLF